MTKDDDYSMFAALARTTYGSIWHMGLMPSAGQLYLSVLGPTAATRGRGTTPVSRNRWYCVEIEFDQVNGAVRLYLDGTLEKELIGLTGLLTVK